MFFSGVLSSCSARVQRGRLARTGRPGDEHRAVGAVEGGPETLELVLAACRASRGRARSLSLSRMRSTTDSPWTLGIVTTRTSTWRPSTVSADAAVLRHPPLGDVEVAHDLDARDDAGDHPLGHRRSSRSTPSIRIRTRISVAPVSGSKWMSEAPRSAAWAMIECTSLITGASSADSRRSTISAGAALSRPPRPPPDRVLEAVHARDQACDVLRGGDRRLDSSRVIIAMSSTASTLAGSAIASSSGARRRRRPAPRRSAWPPSWRAGLRRPCRP